LNTMSWTAVPDRTPGLRQADPLRPVVAALTLVAMLSIMMLIWMLSLLSPKRRPLRPGRTPL